MLAEAVAIHLICAGGGAHAVQHTTTASSVNNMTSPVIISSTSHVGYDDEVAVQIEGDQGKIRVPDGVKPRIRSGGDDGWWKLSDLQIGENEIKAKFGLNFMNHPSVRIDRVSGHISIQGKAGNFDGYCQPYDPSTVQRRF